MSSAVVQVLAVDAGVVVIVVAIAVVLLVLLVTLSMRGRQTRAAERRQEGRREAGQPRRIGSDRVVPVEDAGRLTDPDQ